MYTYFVLIFLLEILEKQVFDREVLNTNLNFLYSRDYLISFFTNIVQIFTSF